jgi:hypothetical protein
MDDRLARQLDVARERTIHRGGICKWQIRSADGTGEEQIAPEGDTVPRECDMAGRVSGHVHHREAKRAAAELLPVGKLAVRAVRLLEVDSVQLRGARRQRGVGGQIERMEQDGYVVLAADRSDRADVIDVRVCQPDRVDRNGGVADHREDAARFVAGIDEDAAPRLLVRDEVAVLLEDPDGANVDPHTA